jgi:hypothetical protein
MAAPVKYVNPKALRKLFNDGKYLERVRAGELQVDIIDVGPAPKRFPADTRSQMVTYRDANARTVAICHQYGQPDGEPAKSTLPDPKFLFEDGTRYKLSRD